MGYSFSVKGLKRLFVQNCQPSIMAWLQAGPPALFHFWWGYNVFDLKHTYHVIAGRSWVDNLRVILGKPPKGGNRGAHSIRLFGRGEGYVPPVIVQNLERFFFRFLILAETVTWYMWFGNLVAKLVFDWWSTAYKIAGCDQSPDRHWFTSEVAIGGWSGDNSWQIGPGWLNCSGTEGAINGSVITVPEGWWISGGFSVQTYFVLSLAPVQLSCRVVNDTTGQILDRGEYHDTGIGNQGGGMAFMLGTRVPTGGGPQTLRFEVMASNGADHGSYFTPGVGFAFASWGPKKPKKWWSPYAVRSS